MFEIFRRNKEPKHWSEERWAQGRRLIIRGDVPGNNYYPPDFSHLFDTEEKRENLSRAMSRVIEDALSDEGPQWARGLTEEELKQPLDLNKLLAEFEAGRETGQNEHLSRDAYEARFDEA